MRHQEYLKRCAYLGERKPDPHIMDKLKGGHRQRQFQLFVMRFQRFAGLNVTGKFNDECAPAKLIRAKETIKCVSRYQTTTIASFR